MNGIGKIDEKNAATGSVKLNLAVQSTSLSRNIHAGHCSHMVALVKLDDSARTPDES
ncbi:hypothetical protein V5O39_08035 [Pseudomonas parakoreensis]